MAWVYLDDHWDENPKLLAAYASDPRAVVLYFAGITYCRRSSPAGVIPSAKVPGLLGWCRRSEAALYGVGCWAVIAAGVEVHDYAEWNRARTSRSASARNAALARWHETPDA